MIGDKYCMVTADARAAKRGLRLIVHLLKVQVTAKSGRPSIRPDRGSSGLNLSAGPAFHLAKSQAGRINSVFMILAGVVSKAFQQSVIVDWRGALFFRQAQGVVIRGRVTKAPAARGAAGFFRERAFSSRRN